MTKQLILKPVCVPCDCKEWEHLRHPDTDKFKPVTNDEMIQVWLSIMSTSNCGVPNVDMWTTGDCLWNPKCRYHAFRRYYVICGPGGHIVGVKRA